MTSAPRDPNQVPALLGVLNSTGTSVVKVLASPTTHALKVSDGHAGSDNGPTRALRDENQVPSLVATSSSDGTAVVVYSDSSGNLLVDRL